MRSSVFLLLVLALMGLFAVTGCGKSPSDVDSNSAVTKSTLDKIVPGMTVAEVQAILGTTESIQEGSARVGNQRVADEEHTWRNGQRVLIVSFVKGKVVYATGVNL